jgi:AcrR family transcriptional regulator
VSSTASAPLAGRAPRWRRRKEARPGEILAAALEQFVEHGYAATRLEDVARRAGVTKGTMYLYFPSKQALFKAVVNASLVADIARGERLLEEHRDGARELLVKVITTWHDAIADTPAAGIPKLMVAEAANFPELGRFYYQEVVQRGHRLVGRVIRMGIERGEFRPVEIEQTVRLAIAPVLLGMVMKYSLHACTGEAVDARKLLRLHLELFLRGIEKMPAAEVPNA